jgi:hypothetical protein
MFRSIDYYIDKHIKIDNNKITSEVKEQLLNHIIKDLKHLLKNVKNIENL